MVAVAVVDGIVEGDGSPFGGGGEVIDGQRDDVADLVSSEANEY